MLKPNPPPHETSASSRDVGSRADADAGDVLDAQALQRLRELDPNGDSGLLERVLRAFEVSVGRLLPQLQQARADGDLASIGRVAHTLKSSSASIGALQLSQVCADCERMARESRTEGLDERLDAMDAQVRSALAALSKLLARDA